jgi:hypothetical protein
MLQKRMVSGSGAASARGPVECNRLFECRHLGRELTELRPGRNSPGRTHPPDLPSTNAWPPQRARKAIGASSTVRNWLVQEVRIG